MEDFGSWSMQYAAADPCLPSREGDDDGRLLGAFLGGGFDLRSDHGDLISNLPSSHPVQNLMPGHGSASLSVSDGFMSLDTADMLASVTGALDDGGLLDTFAYYGSDVVVAEEPAQPTASSNAFSGYSSTTGGYGNISSGESNTCGGGGGGHDTEVASSPCALSRSALPQATAAPASKRKLGKYPAIAAITSTEAQVTDPRRGAKRDSATSSSSTTSMASFMPLRQWLHLVQMNHILPGLSSRTTSLPEHQAPSWLSSSSSWLQVAKSSSPTWTTVCFPLGYLNTAKQ